MGDYLVAEKYSDASSKDKLLKDLLRNIWRGVKSMCVCVCDQG